MAPGAEAAEEWAATSATTTEEMRELVRADYSQTIELKDTEVDSLNEHANKLVFYTDGGKFKNQKTIPCSRSPPTGTAANSSPMKKAHTEGR